MEETDDTLTYPRFDFNEYACMSLKGLYWASYTHAQEQKMMKIRQAIYAFQELIERDYCYYRIRRQGKSVQEHYAYIFPEVGGVAFLTETNYSLATKAARHSQVLDSRRAVHTVRMIGYMVQGKHQPYWFRVFRALQMLLLNLPGEEIGVALKVDKWRLNMVVTWPQYYDLDALAITVNVKSGISVP